MSTVDPQVARRAPRESVEMMACFRRHCATSTVVLKNLTPYGAMIEGVGPLEQDEAISLALPGCRPAMAFVAWANDHSAGLEFVQPLDSHVYAGLVDTYRVAGGPACPLHPEQLSPPHVHEDAAS